MTIPKPASGVPRPEYPRPRLTRGEDSWQNLNGDWAFTFDFGDSGKYREFWKSENAPLFDKRIVVPFVPESKLSGICYTDFFTTCWYRRAVTIPAAWREGRVLLHFGAVDFYCEVWVNEVLVGSHRGGYTPFTLDITDALREGENDIVVRAYDNGRDPLQYTGKQIYFHYDNKSCYYTRCTGIWQTVWLEHVPASYIEKTKITPDVPNRKVDILVTLAGAPLDGQTCRAAAFLDGREVSSAAALVTGRSCAFSLSIPEEKLSLWDLDHPTLYDLTLTVGDDTVSTYFGLRKIAIKGYAIELNDRPVYQRLVLDQGYYEDGIITAPDVLNLEQDIALSKKVGFNGARLHMKVFEPYTLYFADRMGYLLWGEFPSWGLDESSSGALDSFLPGWLEELERDYNSPALIGWCPFNETRTSRRKSLFSSVYRVTRAIDPYRPIIDSSGYVHGDITDIYDVHDYDQDPSSMRERYRSLETGEGKVFVVNEKNEHYDGQPYFVSEMGGIFWDISTAGKEDWGYGDAPKSLEEFYTRFEGLITVLLENPKMCALCYTQLTDVYQEKNGIYAFDRREKFDPARLRAILTKKAAIEK